MLNIACRSAVGWTGCLYPVSTDEVLVCAQSRVCRWVCRWGGGVAGGGKRATRERKTVNERRQVCEVGLNAKLWTASAYPDGRRSTPSQFYPHLYGYLAPASLVSVFMPSLLCSCRSSGDLLTALFNSPSPFLFSLFSHPISSPELLYPIPIPDSAH